MGNPSLLYCMFDGGNHELLTHKIIENLGSFPGCSYFICHECSLASVLCEYTILCFVGVEAQESVGVVQ